MASKSMSFTDERVLQLWLGSDSDLIGLAAGLRGNINAASVSIFIEDAIEGAPCQELLALFEAIGNLDSLQHFYVYSFGGSNCDVIPVEFLTCTLKLARSLEILSLYFLELGGNVADYIRFESALRYHQYLTEFRLESCQLSGEALHLYSPSRLLISLSSLPNIEKVELSAAEMGILGSVSERSIQTICDADNLRSLSLINFPFENGHIEALQRSLENNRSLTDLAISCDPKVTSTISLFFQTASLERFKLCLGTLDNDDFIECIAKNLGKCLSLKTFILKGEIEDRLSLRGQKAFMAAMESNAVLEHLDISMPSDDFRQKIDFYVNLNQNRRALFQSPEATNTVLANALIDASKDLDCLFFFLGMKPCLCQRWAKPKLEEQS